MHLYTYIYIHIFIYIFITKVFNIIHKQYSNLHLNDKEIKPSYQVLRVSCKRVYHLQPVHNELTLCVQWNSILFQTGSARPPYF